MAGTQQELWKPGHSTTETVWMATGAIIYPHKKLLKAKYAFSWTKLHAIVWVVWISEGLISNVVQI